MPNHLLTTQPSENNILLVFNDNVTEATAMALIHRHHSSLIKQFKSNNMYQVSIAKGLTLKQSLTRFTNEADIMFAEANTPRQRR